MLLEMSISDATWIFREGMPILPPVSQGWMEDVGLGYLAYLVKAELRFTWGGEAQRVQTGPFPCP